MQEKKGNFELYDWADALISALVGLILFFMLIMRVTGVVGDSMKPTLYHGDRLIVSKLFYEPKVGDIIVATKESFRSEPIVKRIIAVGDQTVDIDFDAGIIYVDGQPLDEPYIAAPTTKPGDMTFPLYVEKGKVFVMGDNRNYSTDSRWTEIGLLDERMIMGKVLFRLLPLTSSHTLY